MDLDIDQLSVSASADTFPFTSNPLPEGDDNPNSSIASLMQISEKMDSLLPTEGTNDPPVPVFDPASNFTLSHYPAPTATTESRLTNAVLSPYAPAPCAVPESINYSLMYPQPYHHLTNYVTSSPYSTKPPSPLSVITVPDHPSSRPPPLCSERCTSIVQEATSCNVSCKPKVESQRDKMVSELTTSTSYASPSVMSPVSVKDVSSFLGATSTHCTFMRPRTLAPTPSPHEPTQQRPRSKRKPKTYAKPVASRFCHICSRTPRRGHSAAVCSKISEGLCRKIVCEQCFREQGWDFAAAQRNPGQWLCPHCTDSCPRRSQCHIYNRINARRKRTTSTADGLLAATAPAPKRVKKSVANKARHNSKNVKPTYAVKVERALAIESPSVVAPFP